MFVTAGTYHYGFSVWQEMQIKQQFIIVVLFSLRTVHLSSSSSSKPEAISHEQGKERGPPDPDFVYATSTFTARHALVNASRLWRSGLRSFIMTNDSKYVQQQNIANNAHHERYSHYVDDAEQSGTMRGRMTGEAEVSGFESQ